MQNTENNEIDFDKSHETIEFICETFTKTNPICAHLSVSQNEFRPWVKNLVHHIIPQKLSWALKDKTSNQVIAALLSADVAIDFNYHNDPNDNVQTILNFFHTLSNPIEHKIKFEKGHAIHAHMGAVHPNHQHRGLARDIQSDYARWLYNRGYRIMIGETANKFSFQIYSKLPSFLILNSLHYADFEFRGKKPFENLKDNEASYLFQCDLKDLILTI